MILEFYFDFFSIPIMPLIAICVILILLTLWQSRDWIKLIVVKDTMHVDDWLV